MFAFASRQASGIICVLCNAVFVMTCVVNVVMQQAVIWFGCGRGVTNIMTEVWYKVKV